MAILMYADHCTACRSGALPDGCPCIAGGLQGGSTRPTHRALNLASTVDFGTMTSQHCNASL